MKKIIKQQYHCVLNQDKCGKSSLHCAKRQQQGALLVWSIIILLVLTIVGLSAVKTAGIGTKITGNLLFSMFVFQGAESALGKTANIYYTTQAVNNIPTRKVAVPSGDLPDEKAAQGMLSSSVNVTWKGYQRCPITSLAVSSSVASKAGGIACQHSDINAKTNLSGTGARANHMLGVARYGPAQHVTILN
jgi:Tfp pilus assembly protein PilX